MSDLPWPHGLAADLAADSGISEGGQFYTTDDTGLGYIGDGVTPKNELLALLTVADLPSIEPEQFPGATDDLKLAAALAYLLAHGGGLCTLRSGKSYTWANPVAATDIISPNVPIVLDCTGAIINGAHAVNVWAWVVKQSSAPGKTRGLTVIRGTWNFPNGNGIQFQDANNCTFIEPIMNVPNGAFVGLSNVAFWCERFHLIRPSDMGCQEIIRLTVDGGAVSFARLYLDHVKLTGGKVGIPKINIVDSGVVYGANPATTGYPHPYNSDVDGIYGNIADGAIVMSLNGGMAGTRVGGLSVECAKRTDSVTTFTGNPVVNDPLILATDLHRALPAAGVGGIPANCYIGTVIPGTSFRLSSSNTSQVDVPATASSTVDADFEPSAAYFKKGGNLSANPILTDLPPCDSTSNRMLMYSANPGAVEPFAPGWDPTGRVFGGSVVTAKVLKTISGGTTTAVFDPSQGNHLVLSLKANCTALTLGTLSTGLPTPPVVTFPGSQQTMSASQMMVLEVKQDSTGGWTIPWPTGIIGGILWGEQGAPTDLTANSITTIWFVYDNGNQRWMASKWTVQGGSSPLLDVVSQSLAMATPWAALTVYAANQWIVAPTGGRAFRTAAGTSRAAFDATERALWTFLAGGHREILTTGATAWVCPTGITQADFIPRGAGGGGGVGGVPTSLTTTQVGGGGGGGGEEHRFLVTGLTAATSYVVVIGTGGASAASGTLTSIVIGGSTYSAAPGGAGATGGANSAVTANGGVYGRSGVATSTISMPGSGGPASSTAGNGCAPNSDVIGGAGGSNQLSTSVGGLGGGARTTASGAVASASGAGTGTVNGGNGTTATIAGCGGGGGGAAGQTGTGGTGGSGADGQLEVRF